METVAYDTKDLEEKALKAIKKENLTSIVQVACFLPCNRATFYNHGLDKLDSIKEAIYENRTKNSLIGYKKLQESDSPAAIIAYIKLNGTEEDLRRLNPPKQKEDDDKQEKAKPLVEWTEEENENE